MSSGSVVAAALVAPDVLESAVAGEIEVAYAVVDYYAFGWCGGSLAGTGYW